MKKIFIILILILTVPLFAADAIYTWGYGYIFKEILEGVKMVTTNNQIMLASAISVGGLLTMLKNMQGGSEVSFAMIKYMFIVTIIIGIFFESTKIYVIEDEVTEQAYVVQDVPVGIGEIFSLFTNLERSLGKGFETAFSTPNAISYTNAGLGFSMSAHLSTDDLRVKDTYFTRTFNDYIGNCIISAIINKDMSADSILNSSDLLTDLRVTGFESVYYTSAAPEGVEAACEDVWDNEIKNKMDSVANDQIQVLAKRAQLSESRFKDGLTGTSNLLYGIGANAKDYLIQQTLKNLTKDGLIVSAQATGGDAATVAYGAAMAQVNQQQQWALTGVLAKENLPLMKAVLTVLILGIFVLLILLSIVYGEIGHIKMGFTLLFAMVLWTPLSIIVNNMFYLILEHVVQPSLNGEWITMVNAPTMSDKIKNYMSFLGYIGASIPVLAYAIAKKSEQGFVNFFSGVGGSAGSAASSAASQTSSGNISAGNTRVGMTSITDVNGSHNYLGGNSWQNQQLRDGANGSYMQTSYVDQNGNSMYETKGSNADMRIDHQGDTTSISNSTLGFNSKDDISKGHNESKAVMVQESEQFGNSIAHNMVKQEQNGKMTVDTEAFNKSYGLTGSTKEAFNEARSSSISSALKDLVSDGSTLNVSNDTTGKVGMNITADSDHSLVGKIFGNITGMSAKADGGLTISGSSSEGESNSVTLSAEEAKAFNKSFGENFGKELSENQGLAYSLATQHQDTKVFSESSAANEASQYSNAYQKNETYSILDNIAKTQNTSFSQDMLPKLVNSFVDNDEVLSAMKSGGDGVAAADAAIDRIKTIIDDPTHNIKGYEKLQNAMYDVAGVDINTVRDAVKHDLGTTQERIKSFDTDVQEAKTEINTKNSAVKDSTDSGNLEVRYQDESKVLKSDIKADMNQMKEDVDIDNEEINHNAKEYMSDKHKDRADDSKVIAAVGGVVDNVTGEVGAAVNAISSIPTGGNLKNTQEYDKQVNDTWTKATDNGLISNDGTTVNADRFDNFSIEELKMIKEKDINSSGDLRLGGLSNVSEDRLDKEIEFREKGYNSSDFTDKFKDDAYNKAQEIGLVSDDWGSDELQNLNKMERINTQELRALTEFDGAGSNGLNDNAKDTIDKEIIRRQSLDTKKEVEKLKEEMNSDE